MRAWDNFFSMLMLPTVTFLFGGNFRVMLMVQTNWAILFYGKAIDVYMVSVIMESDKEQRMWMEIKAQRQQQQL